MKNNANLAQARIDNYAWFVFRKDFGGVKEVHII